MEMDIGGRDGGLKVVNFDIFKATNRRIRL